MSKSLAKQYYLKQLENGPVSHRTITKRFTGKFLESAAQIKDELVAQGLIVFTEKKLQANGRYAYFFKLTGKQFVAEIQHNDVEAWEDGTAKSKNNAFNWRGKEQTIMSKREIVLAQQKYHNNYLITIYSRA